MEEERDNLEIPFAPQAEAAVICCLIENPKRFTSSAWEAQITDEFFHRKSNSALWRMIFERIKHTKAVDPVSLREAINDEKPESLAVSDLSEILLSEFDSASWHGYVDTLRDRHARRIAIQAGQDAANLASDGQSAVDLLRKAAERASAALCGSSVVLDSKKAVQSFLDSLVERYDNGVIPGISTGIAALDEQMGGLRKGELTVVGAKTSGGKSVLMLQIAQHVVSSGNRVAIFSLEMGADEVIGRMIACGKRIDIGTILNPRGVTKREIQRIQSGALEMKETGLMVCEAGDMTIDAISGHCQRLSDAGGLDLIVIDYLQMVNSPRIKGQNREQEVAIISRSCKQLAKRLKCPVITATQLNEQGQARESRAIENDADNVILVFHEKDSSMIQFWKCRNGKRGTEYKVQLNGEFQRFDFF